MAVINEPSREWATLVPPIFGRCVVADDRLGYGLSIPFVQGDYLYATNRRIAVRILRPEVWPFEPSGRVPEDLGGWFDRCVAIQGEPVVVPAVNEKCRTCHGSKVLPEQMCRYCSGSGRLACRCECENCTHTDPCAQCDGTGLIAAGTCYACRGTGRDDFSNAVYLSPGCEISMRQARMLAGFGAVAYPPENAPPRTGVRFVAGEVEGIIMPLCNGKIL